MRTQAVADAVWPPENSGPQLRDMRSTIYLPAKFSPCSDGGMARLARGEFKMVE
ncbi:UNVERIFIED_ORG: hypothetical protein J2Y84_002336 [Pseudomonas reinekei]|nr:hypothetical protein [Pseudomonas reinekei]MDF9906707.1 hypothetical protein [Pseudomonas reinekei]